MTLKEIPRITVQPSRAVLVLKRALDMCAGMAGCLVLLLITPLIALLIKLESQGPVFYSQIRVGRNLREPGRGQGHRKGRRKLRNRRSEELFGQPFRLYKFRTMGVDAEAAGPQLCQKGGDPRITRVGKWLRRFHLDEVPQFWNVLRGNMSLVGPRPERPFFVQKYLSDIPHYAERMRHVKPGLTGLAQITLGYDESVQTVIHKYYFDIIYRLSMVSPTAWLRMEAWVVANTFLYLAYQVRGQLFHIAAPRARVENAHQVQHVAHPWKLIHRINTAHAEPKQISWRRPRSLPAIHVNRTQA